MNVSLKELMQSDDYKYISVSDFIKLVAKQTGDSPDVVIEYLAKYSSAKGDDIDVYLKGFLSEYSAEWSLCELLINDSVDDFRACTLKELESIGSDEFKRAYFLKTDLFKSKYIKNIGLKTDSLNAFNIKHPSHTGKALPPLDYIETTTSLNKSIPIRIGNSNKSNKSQKQEKVIIPNDLQRITMLYNYFTPHQASCLIAGLHPNFSGSNDDLEIAQGLIKSGLKKGKIKLDDEGEIEAYDLQSYLAKAGWVLEGFNVSLSLEQSIQVTEMQKRINELEKELNLFKEDSNDLREVINVNFTDDEYRNIVELANRDGMSESEFVSKGVMKSIDTIKPFITAFHLNDDEQLSSARVKLLNYFKESENSLEVLFMLANAEIFPLEHSQFSSSQELNIKDSAYFLIAVMKDLLLNSEITGYYFQGDSDKSKKSPTQAALAEYIDSMSIKNLSTRNINGIFSDANRLLKDAMKE